MHVVQSFVTDPLKYGTTAKCMHIHRFVSFCNCQRDFVVEPSPDVTRSAPVVSLKKTTITCIRYIDLDLPDASQCSTCRCPVLLELFFFQLAPPRRRAAAAVALLSLILFRVTGSRHSTPRCYRKWPWFCFDVGVCHFLHQISEMFVIFCIRFQK